MLSVYVTAIRVTSLRALHEETSIAVLFQMLAENVVVAEMLSVPLHSVIVTLCCWVKGGTP